MEWLGWQEEPLALLLLPIIDLSKHVDKELILKERGREGEREGGERE